MYLAFHLVKQPEDGTTISHKYENREKGTGRYGFIQYFIGR